MPSIICRRAPGIARAVARPPEGRTSGSLLPWMTVAGRSSLRSAAGAVAGGGDRVQLAGDAGRVVAAVVGAAGELAHALLVERVAGRADHLEGLDDALDRRLALARRLAEQQRRRPCSSGCPTRRLPVVDMIETSERTRSGCSIAIVWAIIPPIEAPTTWADSIPRWSSRPTVSAAMSRSR